MKKYLVTIVALLLIFIVYSSFLRENVIITREYIYCNDWGGAPSATIKRIIPSEFLKSRKLEELESKDIAGNYKIDTTFCFTTGYVSNQDIDRIYFNRKNEDFNWRKKCHTDMQTYVETISLLELDSWYMFYDIEDDHVHYVYVDNDGETHVYESGIYKGPW